ncbi:MAG: hypothetical protein HY690_08115 [Chloroflexi bacterium]|nr:hypothetical protein [Chloroflexota bacterium]
MRSYLRILLLPLVVIVCVALLVVGIGSLLLTVGRVAAVPTALGLAVAVMALCTFLATRTYEPREQV